MKYSHHSIAYILFSARGQGHKPRSSAEDIDINCQHACIIITENSLSLVPFLNYWSSDKDLFFIILVYMCTPINLKQDDSKKSSISLE